MDVLKNSCDCCGSCCMNGGPALHTEDLELIGSDKLGISNLVTIRKGELVYLPMTTEPHQATGEFIKIQGRGGEWSCIFFDKMSSSCTIYDQRPLACRLLKCWDPEDILNITGEKLLTRFDIIQESDPLLAIIRHHEKVCPVPEMNDISDQLKSSGQRDVLLPELEKLVNTDLKIRALTVKEHALSLPKELFYFGRPLFQLLVPLGVTYKETPVGWSLSFKNL